MKLAVITACLYADRRPIHFLDDSCKRQGIELIPHGIGVTFAGWARTLINITLPEMQRLHGEGYTHVLFTDGIDSIIIAPEAEIVAKYRDMGSPKCLMSADSECYPPITECAKRFEGKEPWNYVNGGGYITEIPYFINTMRYLAHQFGENDGNHQSWIVQGWPVEGMVLDHECQIFQPMDKHPLVQPWLSRIKNGVTRSYPCILHFRGGYCDPQTGRDERIAPIWKELYE